MKNSVVKILMLLVLLCFGIGAWAENMITISSTEGAPGSEVTVSIGLTNTDAVSSLQVSIPLDENLTLVTGSGQLGSRCSSHSQTIGVKDGVLNVFVYSMSMTAFTGNSGEVISFKLKLGNQPVTVSLTPSKTVLTNSGGSAVAGSSESGEVTVRCAKAQYSTMEVDFGAVPIMSTYTETVTVTNVGNDNLRITGLTFSDVNVFSSTTTASLPLTIAPGDSKSLNITYAPVTRGSISRTLKLECNSVSKLNTITLKAQPFAVNELHVQDVSGVSDEEVTVSMTMNNMDPITGYQVEFELPDQLEYVANSFALSARKQDHQAVTSLNGNVLRILVYSGSDKALTGNDGEIGSFKVKLVGRYGTTLTPIKTVLTATINSVIENVVSGVYGGCIDIQSPQINCDATLTFGAVSVTEDCEQQLAISNGGSAPLTISRVTFSNENMSVKESLPHVIASGECGYLTVVYNNVEQSAFDGTMNIYSNDPDQRMKAVTVTGSRFAPNFASLQVANVRQTENLKIEVAVDNYDDLTGLQFDLEYPNGSYEPFDDNLTMGTRVTGMTVNPVQMNDKTIRYFCYFLGGDKLSAGSGTVLTIALRPIGGSAAKGSYTVNVKNIMMGTNELTNKYAGANLSATFSVIDFLKGDANGDGSVTISDAVAIVNKILGNPSGNFNEAAADVSGDGEITITDAVGVVNIILGNGGSSAPTMDMKEPEPVAEPE